MQRSHAFALMLLLPAGLTESLQGQAGEPPIGTVIAMAADIPLHSLEPEWMPCDGRSLLIDEHLRLFGAIGWTHGLGSDPVTRTTFSAPDFRGYFLRGLSGATNRDPDKSGRHDPLNPAVVLGDVVGSVEEDALQSHRHADRGHTHTTSAAQGGWEWSDNAEDRKVGRPDPPAATNGTGYADLGDPLDSGSGAGAVRHGKETRPMNVGVVWLIRAR